MSVKFSSLTIELSNKQVTQKEIKELNQPVAWCVENLEIFHELLS